MKGINFLFIIIIVSCSSEVKNLKDPVQDPLAKRYESYRQCFLESESYKGTKDSSL